MKRKRRSWTTHFEEKGCEHAREDAWLVQPSAPRPCSSAAIRSSRHSVATNMVRDVMPENYLRSRHIRGNPQSMLQLDLTLWSRKGTTDSCGNTKVEIHSSTTDRNKRTMPSIPSKPRSLLKTNIIINAIASPEVEDTSLSGRSFLLCFPLLSHVE